MRLHVQLTPYNVVERAHNFELYKLRSSPGRNVWRLEEVVMEMLQSKNYVFASVWAR